MKINQYLKARNAVFLIFITTCLYAAELPSAPSGFDWQEFEEINAFFLKPNNWFFKHVSDRGVEAFFLTKEDIDKKGMFLTGLSLNYFKNVKGQTGFAPSEVSKRTFQATKSTRKVEEEKVVQHGNLQGIAYRHSFTPKGNNPKITMYTIDFPDDKENTLLSIFFEAPADEWDEAWKLGKPMLDQFIKKE
jgi:hypothetical protein